LKILTSKEVYAIAKNPTIIETVKLHKLRWFEDEQRMEENKD
jgi:hypothetical protein